MYILSHEGESVGTTKLERGDPSELSVSGEFHNLGGAKAMANWIKSIGGEEDEGVVFTALNSDFTLVNQDGEEIAFSDGHLIAVPADDEVYLDLSGIPEDVYKTYFAAHLSALDDDRN